MPFCAEKVEEHAVKPTRVWTQAHPSIVLTLKVTLAVTLAATCCGFWVVYDVIPDPYRLVPLAGLLVLVGITYATSRHRSAVRWRPVCSGIMLQLLMGFLIIRTDAGARTFLFAGDVVHFLLDHVEAGCRFVFGDDYARSYVAFRVLPTVVYFSSLVSMGYYLGWLQHIFVYIARLVKCVMGTSTIESVVAASNIFIGQTEAGVLVAPFLKDLTMSELHSVMTCGFATIAGSMMAAYIGFGVPAEHLLAASVMSCPAALAMSKLSYPETEEIRINVESARDFSQVLDSGKEQNIIDAAASGACGAVTLVASIAANLIAFISIWSLLDGLFKEAGNMLDIEDLTFERTFGYVFWPVALLLGVPAQDCMRVGKLLGVKTFLNEFVAYKMLSELIDDGAISKRAEVITSYALCGFANIGSMGVQLGCLGALAPTRKKDMAEIVVRALVTATNACFMTACTAGLLWQDVPEAQ